MRTETSKSGQHSRPVEATQPRPASLQSILRWPSAEARTWIERFIASACASEFIDTVVAIGSAVRPHGHSGSDLDIIVIYHLKPPLADDAPIDVDVRSFDRDEVEQSIARGNDLLGWGIRYGAPVYDRDGYWARLAERWRDHLPLPSPDLSNERATRMERLARELLSNGDQDAALELSVAMLTHRAWARLLRAGIYPASRPELPAQLRAAGESGLADELAEALAGRKTARDLLEAQTPTRRTASG